MNESIVVGVDIGGSHITAALVDLKLRKVLKGSWTREGVNSHGSAENIIAIWSRAVKKACGAVNTEITKIGIGMPGPVDYENGTCFIKDQDKYESLYGLNIKTLLAESLQSCPDNIRMINDAACFLQGEAFGGAGKGFSTVIGLTLGTGLGSSVYNNYIASDADLWNSSFKESIAEDYLSTRWFVKRYAELKGDTVDDVKYLANLAETSAEARKVFEEFGTNLGLFLNSFMDAEKPEAVVLGGNIAHSFALFEKSLKNSVGGAYKNIPVFKAILGEEAAILGASSLWHVSSEVGTV